MATVEIADLSVSASPINISIAGRIDDRGYHQARILARALAEENTHVNVQLLPLTETDWDEFVKNTALALGGRASSHKLSPLVVYNDSEYIGDADAFYAWAVSALRFKGKPPNPVLYNQMAKSEYRKHLESHPQPHAYLDIAIGEEKAARVVFELYADKCPKTVENFLALCVGDRGSAPSGTRLHYAGSPIHRVVRGGWIQGGDIEGGHGDGGQSVFGPTFHDECLTLTHSTAGVLAMASGDGPHSNGSQFYVTLAPMPWMDGKRVVFGKVVRGLRTLRIIEKLETINQRPTKPVVVVGCGVYNSAVHKGETPE